jgi:oligopeptide transport system substrate-binding protein
MARICFVVSVSLALVSCGRIDDSQPISATLIGPQLKLSDPNRGSLDLGAAMMLNATAQGLVSFDAGGQIEPALAERWIVTDDGLSLIFRIRRSSWPDETRVTAEQVAARIRTAIAPASQNRLRPLFASIDKVIAMTGEVIEIRLKRPDADMLQLFAQPDMAIFRVKPSQATGPYRVHSTRDAVTRLRPVIDPMVVPPEDDRDDIRVRSDTADRALARFVTDQVALVAGGTLASLPLARAAQPPSNQFQVDPAYGVFGLAPQAGSEAVSRPAVRRALAMAIDRQALVRLFGVAGMRASVSVLPAQLDSAAQPAALEWVQLDMAERRARARALIASGADLPELRIAMPPGSGMRLLFASIAGDWKRVGVSARMVGQRDAADLRLIDEVAPQSAALWYLLRVSCARGLPCSDKAETAIRAILDATDSATKSDAIAEADAALASEQVFIPLMQPLRWSLVKPQLTGWRPSAFATHPFRHLRERK